MKNTNAILKSWTFDPLNIASLIKKIDEEMLFFSLRKSDYFKYSDKQVLEKLIAYYGELKKDIQGQSEEDRGKLEQDASVDELKAKLEKTSPVCRLWFHNGVLNSKNSIFPSSDTIQFVTTEQSQEKKLDMGIDDFEKKVAHDQLSSDKDDFLMQAMLWYFGLKNKKSRIAIKVNQDKKKIEDSLQGKELDVQLVFTGNSQHTNFTKIHFEIARGHELNVNEIHQHSNEGLNVYSVSYDLAENTKVKNLFVLLNNERAKEFHRVDVRQKENSRYVSYHLENDGGATVLQRRVHALGEGTETVLKGLCNFREQKKIDHLLQVDHIVGNNTSEQTFSTVLRDAARASFTSGVFVNKYAQKVESSQLNRVLLIGAEAWANSRPLLEILADDVKCAHGASISPIDENQMFYLTSRGIKNDKAESLLIEAFIKSYMEELRDNFPSFSHLLS